MKDKDSKEKDNIISNNGRLETIKEETSEELSIEDDNTSVSTENTEDIPEDIVELFEKAEQELDNLVHDINEENKIPPKNDDDSLSSQSNIESEENLMVGEIDEASYPLKQNDLPEADNVPEQRTFNENFADSDNPEKSERQEKFDPTGYTVRENTTEKKIQQKTKLIITPNLLQTAKKRWMDYFITMFL